jgi:hypothetical protein
MLNMRTHGRISGALSLIVIAAAMLGITACGGQSNAKSSSQKPKGDVEQQIGFDDQAMRVRQARIQNAIRDCMKAQGFEYVPVDPAAQIAAVTGSSRLSDTDFTRQFGYGISTFWGRGGAQADPNQQYRRSLSPADQAAYSHALYGENDGATVDEALDTGDFSKLGGCTRKATETVFGGTQVLTQLQSKLDDLDERINADQRMVRALEKWTSCMAAAGYRFEEPDDIDSVLMKRMERIVGQLPGKFATGPAGGGKIPPYNHAALVALNREEVATARQDLTCEQKNITPVEAVVRPEYEARFRAENRTLFRQIKPVR